MPFAAARRPRESCYLTIARTMKPITSKKTSTMSSSKGPNGMLSAAPLLGVMTLMLVDARVATYALQTEVATRVLEPRRIQR